MSMIESTKTFVRNNLLFLILLGVVYIISGLTVIIAPRGFPIPELDPVVTNPYNYSLFGLSIAALILLLSIGGYLIYRYFKKPPPRSESIYQLVWGFSFIIYSITFLGIALGAWLGTGSIGDMNIASNFFFWRAPMIIWVAGMWIGTIRLFSEDKRLVYIPALLILLAGFGWFIIGLLVIESITIEQTMYGFLFGEFIPMSLVLAYMWYVYRKDTKMSSAGILAVGFTLLSVSYASWAPWHFSELVYIYFLWFNLFIVSLAFILAGFFALPKEITSKVVN
ncbi:MAG: hypothetical protein ACTSP4_10760 [Candidatus Hodarchaeales archaeon]